MEDLLLRRRILMMRQTSPSTATLTMTGLSSSYSCGGYIVVSGNNIGKSATSPTYFGFLVSIDGFQGQTITITPGADWSGNVRFAFLRNTPSSWPNNGTLSYSQQTGFTAQITTQDNPYTATIPSDAKCLYVYRYSNGIDTAPASIVIEGTPLPSITRNLNASLFTANKSVSDTGSVVDATTVCLSDYLNIAQYGYYKQMQFIINSIPSDADIVRANVAEYTSKKTFIRRIGYQQLPVTIPLRPDTVYVRLMIDKMLNGTSVPISSIWFDNDDIQVIGTNI